MFRRLLVPAAILLAVLLAGTTSAWAYWRVTGRGTGTAAADHLVVEVQVPAAGDQNAELLLPGGTGDAVVKVHNASAVPVTVLSVEPNGTPVASNGCSPTGVSFTGQSGLGWPVPAGGTVVQSLPGSVAMSLESAAACQGAGFAIPVTVTVRSAGGTASSVGTGSSGGTGSSVGTASSVRTGS